MTGQPITTMAAKLSRTLLRSMLGDNLSSLPAKRQVDQAPLPHAVGSINAVGPGGYIGTVEPAPREDGKHRVLQRNKSETSIPHCRDGSCKSDEPARPRMRRSKSEPALADVAQSRPAEHALPTEDLPGSNMHEVLKALGQARQQAKMRGDEVFADTAQAWIDKLEKDRIFVFSLQVERAHDRRSRKSLGCT